jgi:hypothetical protein
MPMKSFLSSVIAFAFMASALATASAESIGVNFSGGWAGVYVASDNNLHPLASADAAGVASQAYWNNASVHAGSTANVLSPTAGVLVDSNDNATNTTISWTASNCFAAGTATKSTANQELMNGYIDLSYAGSNLTKITLSNISYATYDVYVYVGSDGTDRIGHGCLVSSGGTSSSTYFKTYSANFDGSTWVAATGSGTATANEAQYIVFHNVTGSSFTYCEAGDTNNVGVCAIQIVSTVPEPSSTVLMLMGVAGISWHVRRRRCRSCELPRRRCGVHRFNIDKFAR